MESDMGQFFLIIFGIAANALIFWVFYRIICWIFFPKREEDPDLIALNQIKARAYQSGKRSGFDEGYAAGRASQ
jgi:hypothetical protein